ncbi:MULTISPECIES: hypothetical protein [unclassified Haladaptatus]|uniref:hypothetical protein n=1 Tax=unclassified Haladaptatus TaxID=2622732 RepID=UPI00209C5A55|nr:MULTISPECIES: hypothetical protein [unclassified Haladaptatus]MCO8246783.1 hypothetical protein [Haladaptatus sp. AB643]MCO8253692.1 hypothetical protein [Haladaptatus sp. AB618]
MVSHENTDDPEERIPGSESESGNEPESERGEEHDAPDVEADTNEHELRPEQPTPPHPPDGPSRSDADRRANREYERPAERPSYRGRYENRVPEGEPEEAEMGARERRERELRERREMHEVRERRERDEDDGDEVPESSRDETERESNTGDVPKYGGPRDPNWRRQRELAKARHRRRDEEIRRYERRADVALSRQRDLAVEKGGKRYRHGRQ